MLEPDGFVEVSTSATTHGVLTIVSAWTCQVVECIVLPGNVCWLHSKTNAESPSKMRFSSWVGDGAARAAPNAVMVMRKLFILALSRREDGCIRGIVMCSLSSSYSLGELNMASRLNRVVAIHIMSFRSAAPLLYETRSKKLAWLAAFDC